MAKQYRHRVTATMIVVMVPGAQGGEVYLRSGRFLPATVDSKEVKRLLTLGLIEAVEVAPATPTSSTGGGNAGGSDSTGGGKTPEHPEGDPSTDWSTDQLKAYAAAKQVDVTKAKTKPEIVAALAAAAASGSGS